MAGRVGLGDGFQPIAGGQIVRTSYSDGIARIPASPGVSVHAVVTGTVQVDPDAGQLVLTAADGRRFDYAGLDGASVTVAPGVGVAAGDIVGRLAATYLELRVTDRGGAAVRAEDWLLGLPDPNELGYQAVGAGQGVDPDAMDWEAAYGQPAG